MDDRTAPLPRNSSRTLAVVAVAALVVIAIAGIVLASLGRGFDAVSTAVASDATQPVSSAMTAASEALARAEKEAGPNYVVFAPGSSDLTEPTTVKVKQLAENARKLKRGTVVIGGRVEVGPANLELARKRAAAIRSLLEALGVPHSNVKIRVEEAPPGVVSPAAANLLSLSLS